MIKQTPSPGSGATYHERGQGRGSGDTQYTSRGQPYFKIKSNVCYNPSILVFPALTPLPVTGNPKPLAQAPPDRL